jgi:nucleoid DNA-binding protein
VAKTKTAAKPAASAAAKPAKPAGKAKASAPKPLSKKALLHAVAEAVGADVSLKHIALIVESLATVGQAELKKTGVLVVPGFAKFVVVAKAAKPAHEGINPFTKQKQLFPAKPASKSVKARPVKALKDAVS